MQRVPVLYPDLSQCYENDDNVTKDSSIPYPLSSTDYELFNNTVQPLGQPSAGVLLCFDLINTEPEVRTIIAPTRPAPPPPRRSAPPSPAPRRSAPPSPTSPVQRIQTPPSLSIASSSRSVPPIPLRRNMDKTTLVNETKTPILTMDSMVGHSAAASTSSFQQMDFLSENNFDTNNSAEIPVVIGTITSQQVSSSIALDEEVSSEMIKKILHKRRVCRFEKNRV